MKPQGVINTGIAGDFVPDKAMSQLEKKKTLTAHFQASSLGHKTGDKIDGLTTIESIQTSLSQMASGKTISAQAVHKRLRGLD